MWSIEKFGVAARCGMVQINFCIHDLEQKHKQRQVDQTLREECAAYAPHPVMSAK